jgi:hypothetical protein
MHDYSLYKLFSRLHKLLFVMKTDIGVALYGERHGVICWSWREVWIPAATVWRHLLIVVMTTPVVNFTVAAIRAKLAYVISVLEHLCKCLSNMYIRIIFVAHDDASLPHNSLILSSSLRFRLRGWLTFVALDFDGIAGGTHKLHRGVYFRHWKSVVPMWKCIGCRLHLKKEVCIITRIWRASTSSWNSRRDLVG